jgi:hypothetical protein
MYQDEPSQVFYDRKVITVIPMVVHYKSAEGQIQHQSYEGLTDERSHAAPTTFGFITKLIPQIQEILSNLQEIHYISDSPTNQFLNKFIVKLVAKHAKYFTGI